VIGSTRAVRAYACTAPVDMRKGYDGLFGLVKARLHRDPLSGELFLFASRDRRRAKVLFWDGTGLCILCKRLERGRFADLSGQRGREEVALTVTELQAFLEGSALVGRVRISPAEFTVARPGAAVG
jgi:transposase